MGDKPTNVHKAHKSASPSPRSKLYFNVDSDRDDPISFQKMFLNDIPTQNRRELTKSKVLLDRKAKAAELERLRADYAASYKAEFDKHEKVRLAREAARNRSTDVLEARKALMDAYTPSSKRFVLKQDAVKR